MAFIQWQNLLINHNDNVIFVLTYHELVRLSGFLIQLTTEIVVCYLNRNTILETYVFFF